MSELHAFPIRQTNPLDSPPENADFRPRGLLTRVWRWSGSEHCLFRRFDDVRSVPLRQEFSVRRNAPCEPMRAIVNELIDELGAQGSSADRVSHPALPLPMRVISEKTA